jgi:hypothetical protein
MIDDILTRVFANQWAVFLVVIALMLAFAEAGFRLGLRLYVSKDEARKGQIGGIQGAVLGLLGLLLGFTFAMAVDRFNTRRSLVLEEANAVGTTYLRASLLPDAHVAPVKDLLRRYVDVRVTYQPLMDDRQARRGLLSADIRKNFGNTPQRRRGRNPITATFIETLNDTGDADSKRTGRAGIPGECGCCWYWSQCSAVSRPAMVKAQGARTKLGSVFLPLLITVVIVLIFVCRTRGRA